MIKNLFLNIQQFFLNIKQIKTDKENRKKFIEDITQEIVDPMSTFNKLKLQCDDEYTRISCVINIPEEYQMAGSDIDKYRKLNELTRPVNKYLVRELNWGEYFLNPDFYYIDTNTDPNMVSDEISCAYIATWKYSPVLNKYPNFKYQLAFVAGMAVAVIAGLILLIVL